MLMSFVSLCLYRKIKENCSDVGTIVRIVTRRENFDEFSQSQPTGTNAFVESYDIDFKDGGRIKNVLSSNLIHATNDDNVMKDMKRNNKKKNKDRVIKKGRCKEQDKRNNKIKEFKEETSPPNNGVTCKSIKSKKRIRPRSKANTRSQLDDSSTNTLSAIEVQSSLVAQAFHDLLTRHLREFEKTIQKLERVDRFAFFFGVPPPELDDSDSENDDNTELKLGKATKQYSKPPFNFKIVRKRKEHGRYYMNKLTSTNYETKLEFINDEINDPSDEKKKKLNSLKGSDKIHDIDIENHLSESYQNKVVNWDLFRSDIISMCDAAISRDPYAGGGGPGTLG